VQAESIAAQIAGAGLRVPAAAATTEGALTW